MVDYSGPFNGDINRRIEKSNESLLIISGIEKGSSAWTGLLNSMNKEFIRDIPNYLPMPKVKELKEECKRQKAIWMMDDDCTQDDKYSFETLKLLNQYCRQGCITWRQRFFIGCSIVKISNWWFQSDEELEIAKEEFSMFPEISIPCLNAKDEIYHKGHNTSENLYDVLREESNSIEKYCYSRSWPVVSVEWIIESLEHFRSMVLDLNWKPSDWDFENALVRQFKAVRERNPEKKMIDAATNPDPRNYLMSTRGNNYNDSQQLRSLLQQYGWNEGIPSSIGALFWYDSKILPVTKHESQIAIAGSYDHYDFGTGKKTGGSFRIFYYTSPQINMFGNVASKIISKEQDRNKYCAYRDQKRGQEQLLEAAEAVGIDSTEYSDHQTVLLLKWILEVYGFGSYAEPLAHSLQLPIRVVDKYHGERFLQPINGTLAGGKLDVTLINDAGLIISWLAGKWTQEKFDGFVCGDDWTYYFIKRINKTSYLALHSLCACFNQIVNPDKTEWLSEHSYIAFCQVASKMMEDGSLVPASGLPVNLWLKEVTCIQDISQILLSLDKTKSLYWLHDHYSAELMVKRLLDLWEGNIIESEYELGCCHDMAGGLFELRKKNALKIPYSIGGLLLNEEDIDLETYYLGAMDGISQIFSEYRRLPTKIATFIKNAQLTGLFPDYIGQEMARPIKDLVSLVRDIATLYGEWEQKSLYDRSLLRSVIKRCRELSEDYASNSDGKSRVSTKDRTTPKRDRDTFLDAFCDPQYPAELAIRELKRADVTLLDALANNIDLSDMSVLYSFVAIRNTLSNFLDQGLITGYGGYGSKIGEWYYCLNVVHHGKKKRIRLSPVVNDRETANGTFLPAINIEDDSLRSFVYQCRQLIGESQLDMDLITVRKKIKKKVLRKILSIRESERKEISSEHRREINRIIDSVLDELD